MQSLLDVVPGPPFVAVAPDDVILRGVKKYLGFAPTCLHYLCAVPWMVDLVVDVLRPPVFAAPPV